MRKTCTLLFLIAFLLPAKHYGQQDPQYSQYWFAKLSFNPGYAGNTDAICGTLIYRNQWTGFGDEPKTALFSIDMPVKPLHGGLGLNVTALDNLGFEKNMYINLNYAYRQNLGAGRLGVGVGLGYVQKGIDGTKFIFYHPNDPNIPTGNVSGGTFDVSFGAYYETNDLYVGLSSSHLIEGEIKYGNVVTELARHYFITAGYNYQLGNADFELKPSLLAKTDAASTTVDINCNLMYKSQFWGGLGYRLDDAIIINIGTYWNSFKFGYSYDLTLSDIKTYSSGSHEFMVGYCFKPVPKPPKRQFHRNVRFL